MRAIIGCEFTGVVRRAMRARGIDTWSNDLLDAEDGSPYHLKGDVRKYLGWGWDLGIFHPPCTRIAVSGARWFHLYPKEQEEALEFVRELMDAPIPCIAIENPISVISSRIRKPDQIIQPWMFGHPEFKATCLWLKNLPKLEPTNVLAVPAKGTDEWKRWNKVHRASPGPDRWKERSRTFEGIAKAMAEQWGRT